MSDVNATQQQLDQSFTARLDIKMVTTKQYIGLIEACATTPRAVVCAIGPGGIGKTQIPKQIAKRRNAPYMAMHIPQMSIEDYHIPTTASDTKRYYDRRIPRRFQEVIEFVEKLRKEHDGKLPEGRNPIIAIEELNRSKDKAVTQAAFTLLEDRMIGDTYIDDYIQLVVTMNPSGGVHAVNEFERDPACRRRLLMVGVTASVGDFLNYAREMKFYSKVVEHLEAQPSFFYDGESAAAGKVYPCPASWETVSQLCTVFESQDIKLTSDEAYAAFAGKIGATATEAFLEFVKDATSVITPEEVLGGYAQSSAVRTKFQGLVEKNRNDKIANLSLGVAMKIFSNTKRKPDSFGRQLALFMEDMPEDALLAFVKLLNDQSQVAADGKKYLVAFNTLLASESYFNNAMRRLQEAKKKGAAEANASGFNQGATP